MIREGGADAEINDVSMALGEADVNMQGAADFALELQQQQEEDFRQVRDGNAAGGFEDALMQLN